MKTWIVEALTGSGNHPEGKWFALGDVGPANVRWLVEDRLRRFKKTTLCQLMLAHRTYTKFRIRRYESVG